MFVFYNKETSIHSSVNGETNFSRKCSLSLQRYVYVQSLEIDLKVYLLFAWMVKMT